MNTIEMNSKRLTSAKFRIALIQFYVLAFFLFSSEMVNAIFNHKLDAAGYNALQRIAFAFKPTVVVIFVVFYLLLTSIILRFLRPLFSYLRYRSGFDRARTANLNMPWIILIFQIIAWTAGTTTYYAVQNWNAESGIPFALGLSLKLASGIIGAVYASLLITLELIPLKKALAITDIRESENDIFFRYKDEISVLSIAVYLIVNYTYITYYFSEAERVFSRGEFYAIMGGLGLFYLAVSYGLIHFSKKNYYRQIETLQTELTSLSEGTSDLSKRVVITHFNELGDMAININMIVRNFAGLLKQIRETAALLTESAHSLSSAAQENSSTSNQQAASVKEVVTTMEDSNRLSKSVGRNIDEVASRSVRTKEDVQEGFTIIRGNKEKMEEVRDANARTISGVKNLNEEIGSIWEIVKIINGIAGQIKIIAFNAELEASAAGEAGKNFEIVANEIRRLADRTVGSTTEIRKKIGEIQSASDSLIGLSEEGTKKINEGWEMASNIENVFENILSSSEDTAVSAGRIATLVRQQVEAFEQILLTLKQISEGISNAVDSTKATSGTAEALREKVKLLNAAIGEYRGV